MSMSIFWLAPAALLGLALIALPIAIHLLVRRPIRRVDYPSLRFLRQSQLAAFRWRTIQDALLLVCRVAIVGAAVLALAGPVIQTAARSAGHAGRVASAVILAPGAAPAAAADVAAGAFASKTFARDDVADAIADATRWLGEQPPATREIVFVGAFRRGQLSMTHVRSVPAAAGIRFVTTTGTTSALEVVLPVLRSRDGRLVMQNRQVHLDVDATRVTAGDATPVAADILRIIASPADQALADAALRAAVAAGLRWSDPAARVLIAWGGADQSAVRQMLNGASLIRMDRPAPAAAAASAVADAVERLTAAPVAALEPVRITNDELKAWSRSPGPPPGNARPVDEGDRRWLWGVALGLLVLELGLRRASCPPGVAGQLPPEARVA